MHSFVTSKNVKWPRFLAHPLGTFSCTCTCTCGLDTCTCTLGSVYLIHHSSECLNWLFRDDITVHLRPHAVNLLFDIINFLTLGQPGWKEKLILLIITAYTGQWWAKF